MLFYTYKYIVYKKKNLTIEQFIEGEKRNFYIFQSKQRKAFNVKK